MSSNFINMDAFRQSCENFRQYPSHLQHRDWLIHNLKAWFERLNDQEGRLFNERNASVNIYDYDSRQPGMTFQIAQQKLKFANSTSQTVARESRVTSLERLQASVLAQALPSGHGDPQCRFV